MLNAAIIFDVDGVLLQLTREEEELFFQPFAKYGDASKLSRDWNSYRIRNDEDITKEICARFEILNYEDIKSEYLNILREALLSKPQIRHSRESGNPPDVSKIPAFAGMTVEVIEGAAALLSECYKYATLGIATANFREAAKLRLEHSNLWPFVSAHAFGADGGGHKHEVLGRALASFNIPKFRTVYIGDNVNDVIAGQTHGVHFVGFSESPQRLEILSKAGATNLSANHSQTLALIKTLLTI